MIRATVPKAPVYEDGYSRSGEDQVCLSPTDGRKRGMVHAISQSCGVDEATNGELRSCIAPAISTHHRAGRRVTGPTLCHANSVTRDL